MLDAHAVIEAFGLYALFEGQHRDFVVGRGLAVKEALGHEAVGFGGFPVALVVRACADPEGVLPCERAANSSLQRDLVGAVGGANIAFSDLSLPRVAPCAGSKAGGINAELFDDGGARLFGGVFVFASVYL